MHNPFHKPLENYRSPKQIGWENFNRVSIFELNSFVKADDIESCYPGIGSKSEFWRENELRNVKYAIKAWLWLIQSSRSNKILKGIDQRSFLQHIFGEDWKARSQSVINTLCTKAPDEWIEEFEDAFKIEICKEDEIDYSKKGELLMVYQEATEKDIEITFDFIDNFLPEDY